MLKTIVGILGKAIAAVLSIAILALIGTGAMLSRGPVSLAPLAPYLENFMDDPTWRFRVRFDDAVLSWEGWRKKLDLRIIGARFMDRAGAELILVPRMSVVFDGEALLSGQFRVTGLELIKPKLALLRRADGSFEITNSDDLDGAAIGTGFTFDPAMLDGGSGQPGVEAFGALRRLSVRGAALSFWDAQSGTQLTVPSADFSMTQDTGGEGVAMRLSTRLRIGASEAAFGLSALYQDSRTPMIVAVNFAEVHVAGLAKAIDMQQLAPLLDLDIVAAGRLDMMVQIDGSVDELSFDVTTGPGRIRLAPRLDKPVEITGLAAKGNFSKGFTELSVSDLHLDLGAGLSVQAAAALAQHEDGVAVRAKGRFVNLSMDRLPLYWPKDIGADARSWIFDNIPNGLITEGRFDIDIRPGDLKRAGPRPGMARLNWTFRDVRASYFGEFPVIEAAHGSGSIDGIEFGLTIDGATAGGLQLSEGRLHIADLTAQPPLLDVELVAHGPVPKALSLLNAKPLAVADALGLRPKDTGGTSATRARFKIPLSTQLNPRQIRYSAAANLANLSMTGVPAGFALSNGTFTLAIDQDGLISSGMGNVNGAPVSVEWKRSFKKAAGAPDDQFTVRGDVDAAQWQVLGLPPVSRVNGKIAMAISIDAYGDGIKRGAGRFDLTGAEMDWREIGWNKPAAVPAEMTLNFHEGRSGIFTLEQWAFVGGGLSANGTAKFDGAANLMSLTAKSFTLGATQVAIQITAGPGDGYQLDVAGPGLDLRFFTARGLDFDRYADEPPMDLNLALDQVYLTDDVVLTGLTGSGQRRNGKWFLAHMRGNMTGGKNVGFTVRAEPDGRRFTVVAGDAGGMARALGLYPDARGGTMHLTFLVPRPPASDGSDNAVGVITGNLRADNFSVVKARVLTRLLTLVSLTGLIDALNDQGITFTRLDVPFTMRGRQLHIERARAVGPALAVIATGDYDRETEGLNFPGTIVPSYTLNSVLGVIPILGNLLIGREGEGVFAFTYRVGGTLEKPNASVNLLAALAPGFLRRIVEGLEDPAAGDKPTKPDAGDQ